MHSLYLVTGRWRVLVVGWLAWDLHQVGSRWTWYGKRMCSNGRRFYMEDRGVQWKPCIYLQTNRRWYICSNIIAIILVMEECEWLCCYHKFHAINQKSALSRTYLFFSVAAPTTPHNSEGVCPSDDWTEFGDYCYYWGGTGTGSLQFEEADLECGHLAGYWKGHLASIHNKVTNQWLLDTFGSRNTGHHIWIGLRRDDMSKFIIWVRYSSKLNRFFKRIMANLSN